MSRVTSQDGFYISDHLHLKISFINRKKWLNSTRSFFSAPRIVPGSRQQEQFGV